MEKIKVSKNLFRGRKIRCLFGVYWLWIRCKSVAWDRGDGTYLVRPAAFFIKWDDASLKKQLGRLYCTSKK